MLIHCLIFFCIRLIFHLDSHASIFPAIAFIYLYKLLSVAQISQALHYVKESATILNIPRRTPILFYEDVGLPLVLGVVFLFI